MSKLLSLTIIYDWECPLSEFTFFDVKSGKSYFDENESKLFEKWYRSGVAKQLDEIIKSKEPVSIYFSGPFLEQFEKCDPGLINKIKSSKHINILGGTYHHSLASLFSISHFEREVNWHQKLIQKLFGKKPTYFLNTENIYFNELSIQLKKAGYQSTFTGAIDWYLGEKKFQRVFNSRSEKGFKLMLVSQVMEQTLFHNNEMINNFMQLDSEKLETLGGWNELIRKIKNKATLVAFRDQLQESSSDTYNIRQPISSSYNAVDLDQLKNYPLQESWLKQLYGLEPSLAKKTESLQKNWSRLGSISVLKHLNPELERSEENNSYDNYQSLINILSDLHLKL